MNGETVQIALQVIGIIRTQDDRLDLGYLRNWAGTLEVDDLLERVLADSKGA